MNNLHHSLAEWSHWFWLLVANHLWQATLMAIFAWISVALLRRAPASARYCIWLVAFAKFVVPSGLLLFVFTRIGWEFPDWMLMTERPSSSVEVFLQFVSPFADPAATSADPALQPMDRIQSAMQPGHNELYCVLTFVWVIGAVALCARWLRQRTRLSMAIRAGSEVRSGLEWEVL